MTNTRSSWILLCATVVGAMIYCCVGALYFSAVMRRISPAPTPVNVAAIYTQAAQTVFAQYPTSTKAPTQTQEPISTPTETLIPTETLVPTPRPDIIEPGTYIVGIDVQPGTYKGQAGDGILSSCYWERLSSLDGAFDSILANDNSMNQFYVEILPSDYAFKVDCELVKIK